MATKKISPVTTSSRANSRAKEAAPTAKKAAPTVLETPAIDPHGLTQRQQLILKVIKEAVDTQGYPPSMREIGEAAGLASPASVKYQLEELTKKAISSARRPTPAPSKSQPPMIRSLHLRAPQFHCSELSRLDHQSLPNKRSKIVSLSQKNLSAKVNSLC